MIASVGRAWAQVQFFPQGALQINQHVHSYHLIYKVCCTEETTTTTSTT